MTQARDDVERVATARLIGAAATLDPAGRALLNLWMHRGLSDAALADMAGLSAAAVTSRKLDIVEHLSTELGLPPYEVLAALGTITRARQQLRAAPEAARESVVEASRESVVEASRESVVEASLEPVMLPPLPPVRLRRGERPLVIGSAGAGSGRSAPGAGGLPARAPGAEPRRVSRARLGAAAVILVAVAIAILRLTGDHHVPAASGRLAAVAVIGRRRMLRPLAGAPGSARGDVALASSGRRRVLLLRLSGLRAPGDGHYEAWLYTTIIDSRPLGRIPAAGGRVTLALPPGASRFRWIDVSLQPPGFADNSGESVLRAANPAALHDGVPGRS